jgi:hypothetical protein
MLEKKNSQPPPGIDHPARSPALYHWAIPAPRSIVCESMKHLTARVEMATKQMGVSFLNCENSERWRNKNCEITYTYIYLCVCDSEKHWNMLQNLHWTQKQNSFCERSEGIHVETVHKLGWSNSECSSASSHELPAVNFDDPCSFPALPDTPKCHVAEHGLVKRQFYPGCLPKSLPNGECVQVNRKWLIWSAKGKLYLVFHEYFEANGKFYFVWLIHGWVLIHGDI